MEQQVVLFLAYHRLHLFTFETLFDELERRGYKVVCGIFGEHIAKRQVEPELVEALGSKCEVIILNKNWLERAASRLMGHLAGHTREHRWARRAARVIDEYAPRMSAVVVPLHYGTRHVYDHAKHHARFVAVQYEPLIQNAKIKRMSGFTADVICTWGEQDSEAIRRIGVRAKVYAAGAPTVRVNEKFGIVDPETRPAMRLLYTSSPLLRKRQLDFAVHLPYTRQDYARMKRDAMSDLCHLLEHFPQAQLKVKLHPFDQGLVEKEAVEGARRVRDRVEIIEHRPNVPAASHLEACDLLFTMGSTTAFEALALGKPIVLLNYENWVGKHEMNYLAHSFALAATNTHTLLWAVRKTLFDKETQVMLAENRTAYLRRVVEHHSEQAVLNLCSAITGDVDG